MELLITYSSLTGNTEKVARAIHEVLPQADLLPMAHLQDPNAYEGIILGFWAWRAQANPQAQDLLKKIRNKPLGLFCTFGARPQSDHVKKIKTRTRDLALAGGNTILASFACQGKINPESTKRRLALPKDDPHYLTEKRLKNHLASRSHPDQEDLAGAQEAFRNFYRDLANFYKS